MKRALVTGNLGFVGRHFVRRLQADGWYVRGVDIKSGGDARTYFRKSEEPYRYDLAIHLAAVVGGRATIEGEPMKVAVDLAIDADFFQWVLRAQPHRAVYYSSSAAYPIAYQNENWLTLSEGLINLTHPKPPDAIYGWVKLTGELVAQHCRELGAHLQVYRPFSGYGGDQDWTYPFPSILHRALRGDDPIVVWGTGRQRRDWIHIDDIVDATMRGLDYDESQGPINLCTGRGCTMKGLALLAGKALGRDVEVAPQPEAPAGVLNRVGRAERMIQLLGTPKVTLEGGIERELEVLRARIEGGDVPA